MGFEMHLEDNLFFLEKDFKSNNYEHSGYKYFQVFDNKKRDIHKANIRDRVVHQIIFDYLTKIFEPAFISDSYSSRIEKGQFKAVSCLKYFIKLSSCGRKQCYVLKCDIKKYFDNIDQKILLSVIKSKVSHHCIFSIIEKIVYSYHSKCGLQKGIPLGNITSQIFANIYLNILDQYIKKELKCRFFVRYNDDFIIISNSKEKLNEIKDNIVNFVRQKLLLEIPNEKISIRKACWGIDFLGFVVLPNCVLIRDKTKNKMYLNISQKNITSYLGLLKHCNSYNLKRKILSMDKISRF